MGACVITGRLGPAKEFPMYPAHSVCRRHRHTECAGYIVATLLDPPAVYGRRGALFGDAGDSKGPFPAAQNRILSRAALATAVLPCRTASAKAAW